MAMLKLEDFMKAIEEYEREGEKTESPKPQPEAVVRVLKDCRIALPHDNPISPGKVVLILRKEDVLSLPERYIHILQKRGFVEVIAKV